MLEIIFIIILFASALGMGTMIFLKRLHLVEVSLKSRDGSLPRIKKIIGKNGTGKLFSRELLLQKILSKFRVLTIRTENKTSNWLVKLRQKSIENKDKFSEDYWKKIKRGK